MSYNEPLTMAFNLTNTTNHRHCLMNAEMVDLRASIYSTAVVVNVFFYTGMGMILPTVLIAVLSILIFRKGSNLWNELRCHHSTTENISLRCDSPIVEYLRTYNAAFSLGVVFALLSVPCKLLRLLVLFASNYADDYAPSNHLLLRAHAQMQTLGLAFELSLYSYKCFVVTCTNHRFRCALQYLFRYQRSGLIIDQRMATGAHANGHQLLRSSHSQESVPFENLYKHLQKNDFDLPIHVRQAHDRSGSGIASSYSHRSSFKTRSSVCSRRTKEDEISL